MRSAITSNLQDVTQLIRRYCLKMELCTSVCTMFVLQLLTQATARNDDSVSSIVECVCMHGRLCSP